MNSILEQINSMGAAFVQFALPVLVQSSVLIVILLAVDFLLRNRVRAVFRYWLWMLVLVKLVLPPGLSSPVSVGHWLGSQLEEVKVSTVTTDAIIANTPQVVEPAFVEASRTAPLPAMTEPVAAEVDSLPAGPVVSAVPVTWQGALFLAWLAVVAAMALLLGQRAMFVYGLVTQAKKADGAMVDTFRSCCERMRVKGKVGLKVSANAASPAVCGLFRPVVLLPQNLAPNLGPGHLRAVLLHELAHIKRGDLWVNLVQTLLQIFYFYNPLLWLANAVIRRTREQAVDESVQVAMGERARQYPQTLVDVAKLALERPALSLRLIGVVESKSLLKERVKCMLSRPIPKSAKLGVVGVLAVVIAGAVLLPMAKGEWEKDVRNPVSSDENGKPIVTHTLYIQGQPEEPVYMLEGKTYSDVEHIVARIGELMKQKPFPYIRVYTTSQFQRQQEPIERLGKLCREIGFINMEFKYELECSHGEFKATLSSGVTVELVGVCQYPSEGKQWWRPDGSRLDMRIITEDKSGYTSDYPGYEIAFKFSGRDFSARFDIKGSDKQSGLDVLGPEGVHVLRAHIKPQISKTRMKVGVAAGKWETVAGHTGHGTTVKMIKRFLSRKKIIFSAANETKDGLVMTVSDDLDWNKDTALFAVDENGAEHKGKIEPSLSVENLQQQTFKFSDVLLKDIKEFQFRTRPYQWVTFKNVSLKPNFKTNVQIEVEQDGVGVTEYEKTYDKVEDWEDKWQRWEEQMRQWGEEFGEKYGEQMEQWGEEFGEQWEDWGEQMEEWGKQMQEWKEKRRSSMPVMPQVPIIPQTPMMPRIPQVPVMPPQPPIIDVNMAVKLYEVQQDNATIIEEFSAPLESGSTLEVETRNGAITVNGTDITDCKIKATIIAKAQTEQRAEQLAKETKIKPESSEKKLAVKIKRPTLTSGESVTVNFDIVVPMQTSVNLISRNGAVTVEKTSGNIQIATRNGQVMCREIDGDLTIAARNGHSRIVYSKKAAPVCEVSITSRNGKIDFTPPPDFSASVEVTTRKGSIHSDLPIAATDKTDNSLKGTVGNGEGKLYLQTRNGSITIRGRKIKKTRTVSTKKKEIITKLFALQEQQERIQNELRACERTLDEVRERFGFTDLEEHSYPHPVTSRLTRLELERDNCILEISQLQATIDNFLSELGVDLSKSQAFKSTKADLIVLQRKLEQLEKMAEEAKIQERNLNLARIQYKQRASIRDETRQRLNEVKSQIDKLTIMYGEAARADKEKPKTAKALKIVVYEGDKLQPQVTLKIPLVGLKVANTFIPQQAKKQMAAQGIDLGEILKQVDNGLEPTTLLDVMDGKDHVIISLE